MNILLNKPPEMVEIGGNMYPINSDFRACVSFEIMIDEGEKDFAKIVRLFFPDGIPDEDIEEIAEAIIWFYAIGASKEEKRESRSNTRQAYSFDIDSNIIYSDFLNFYNIDLSKANMHWWEFRALLDGLPDKSEFKQRVYYRTCDTNGMSKPEKKRIAKIRKILEIKKTKAQKMTLQERDAKMLSYVANRAREIGGGENG